MPCGRIVLGLLVLMSIGAASALDIKLETEDNVSFYGVPIQVIVATERESRSKIVFTHADNTIVIDAIAGDVTIEVVKDKIYRGHAAFNEEVTSIFLRPVAKVSGYVIDEKENLLQHVPLKIVCTSSIGGNVPTETDNLGFFSIEEIGFGECDIDAIAEKVYSYHLIVNESKHYSIRIPVESEHRNPYLWVIALGIVVFIVAVYFITKNGEKTEKAQEKMVKVKEQRQEHEFSKRQQDILTTLLEREKEIVTQLFYNKRLTQSQLRYKTGLPKSSLHRVLTSLQQKNLVIVKEEAGIKKVSLTEFFLK